MVDNSEGRLGVALLNVYIIAPTDLAEHVAGIFQDREESRSVHLVLLVKILSLVFTHPTHHVEGIGFDLLDIG